MTDSDTHTADQIRERLASLPDWQLSQDDSAISRRFEFKGFAKAVEMANLAAWLGNKRNHHPDISFGWGYCEVSFTSHDAGGLTARDFDSAAHLDALLA
ncbi:MAG: 4a-hydroxytetrahydrobiopterin dehydratase [Paracoccus denitrificans]|uniref:Putative pterin-4-alpha-carbinolamine dehydratase n=1 Tax=Paracoccus denitrificans TaxID=266 RepID=A0A533I3J9_PARDE|nr:MAG: 4a-hydroxytetrahydrobiopterin dehydratase [Paracoccus denitrificans]